MMKDYLSLSGEEILADAASAPAEIVRTAVKALDTWRARDLKYALPLSSKVAQIIERRAAEEGRAFAELHVLSLLAEVCCLIEHDRREEGRLALRAARKTARRKRVYQETRVAIALRSSWFYIHLNNGKAALRMAKASEIWALRHEDQESLVQAHLLRGHIAADVLKNFVEAADYLERALDSSNAHVKAGAALGLARLAARSNDEEAADSWLEQAARWTDSRLKVSCARIHWIYGKRLLRARLFEEAAHRLLHVKLVLSTSSIDIGLLYLDLATARLGCGRHWDSCSWIREAEVMLVIGGGPWAEEAQHILKKLTLATLTCEALFQVRETLTKRAREMRAQDLRLADAELT